MKKIKTLLMLFITFSFLGADCSRDEDIYDNCLKKEPLIEGTFILSANIQYSDGLPYEGPVKFKIYKMYCDGTQKGVYTREGVSNATGYYSTAYIYTYKFDNLYDEVKFYFKITNESTGVEKKVWFEYSYNDVKNEDAHGVNQAFPITLSWSSGEQ